MKHVRCLQNYIPAHSLTLPCPMCRQTSILPEKGVSALQNNFFISNLMDVLQRIPENSIEESSLETVTDLAVGKPLPCPSHNGNVKKKSLSAMKIGPPYTYLKTPFEEKLLVGMFSLINFVTSVEIQRKPVLDTIPTLELPSTWKRGVQANFFF
ncbi:tripartite motif-containing protein 2-like isoform X2 [Numida meleagris]|uniref:tripartite motif-containing protein 2-like isoform X2 n=1 Tax=Numida meleagris TaxID=8996 RepID=UPI000B3E349D|nr:tripartite motif-containing protein 2-like isoform X2 [Numida meleagris]